MFDEVLDRRPEDVRPESSVPDLARCSKETDSSRPLARSLSLEGREGEICVLSWHTSQASVCLTSGQYHPLPCELQVITHAVSKMLPKNKLRAKRLARLKVFQGEVHPYEQNIIKRYDLAKDGAWEGKDVKCAPGDSARFDRAKRIEGF